MSDISITKESKEDRFLNRIKVSLHLEGDCDPHDQEYSLYIDSFLGSLDLHSSGGVDDVSLIKDCIENNLDRIFGEKDHLYLREGYFQVLLIESGEWEGVCWNKYYEVQQIFRYEYI